VGRRVPAGLFERSLIPNEANYHAVLTDESIFLGGKTASEARRKALKKYLEETRNAPESIDNSSDSEKNDLLDYQIKPLITESGEQEFIAPNMTEEEKEILEQLRRERDLRDQIPEDERIPISHPDKYSVSD
jgi:hypothetical protein